MFTYLLTGSFGEYFPSRVSGFIYIALAWRHKVLPVQYSLRFFTRSLSEILTICSRRHLSSKLFLTRSLAWDSVPRDLSSKTDFFYPISADGKKVPLISLLSSSFPCQSILYDHYLFHPVTECKHLLAFILTWIFYVGRGELTYITIPLFSGGLWRPANSNTEGL